MITLLRNLFLNHWERKLLSLFLAIVIWLFVNHSLTTTKTLDNVAIRLINIPSGMTVAGLQPNGMLSKKTVLSLHGNKKQLSELTSNDFEVVLDAMDKSGEWLATVSRKNLMSLNPDIDLTKMIKRVGVLRLPIRFTRMVTEKIPIFVMPPIGKGPRDYQYLDIWPSHLSMTVSGPEEVIKHLRAKGMSLAFNLNNISRVDLEAQENKSDEVSFFVPDEWKQIEIPELSERPFEIDDPKAKELRIDFVKSDFHPIARSIPISLFFPPEHSLTLNPEHYSLAVSDLVHSFHGLHMIRRSLYAKGVSRLFVELVQDMIELSVMLVPKTEKKYLDWSIQFQNPRILEDRYVSILMSEDNLREEDSVYLKRREEYLRNRFRNYMNRLQLYKSNHEKFKLQIEVQNRHVTVHEIDSPS